MLEFKKVFIIIKIYCNKAIYFGCGICWFGALDVTHRTLKNISGLTSAHKREEANRRPCFTTETLKNYIKWSKSTLTEL